MSDPSAFGFGQFVPGFDFLQNLSKTASTAQPTAAAGMPGMASWVAPTLSVEDIDKRIQELKSVLFWLEQNTTALKATIQAMEVQKMTFTTLQSMNVNLADLAKAFTARPPAADSAPASADVQAASTADAGAAAVPRPSLFTPKAKPQVATEAEPAADPAATAHATEPPSPSAAQAASDTAKPAVDPMQWWGALTQQFQGIAAAALKDVAGEAMKVSRAAQATRPVKAPSARKAASAAKGQATAAPGRGRTASTAKSTTARTARGKSTGAATQASPKSSAAAPRKAAKK